MLDSAKVKDKLSVEDIQKLCFELQGDDEEIYDAQGHPIFSTCLDHPGGDAKKTYYYPETKLFHTYTTGTTKDIFEIVQNVKGCDFKEAFDFVVDYFNLRNKGFDDSDEEEADLIADWDIFQKAEDYSQEPEGAPKELPTIDDGIMDYFSPLVTPEEWLSEGIGAEVMSHYGIRIDCAMRKIVIPHRNVDGKLIGIRGRSFDPVELRDGKKYMPVFIEGTMYSHPLGKNLFGIYENKETIRKARKVCVFEAEKSVLQIATMYGVDNCFAVATCGSSLSQDQMDMLLKLGVTEVTLAFDADHTGGRGDPDVVAYEEKLRKTVEPLLPYVNVSIIFDYDHILPHKASPSDCGREKFEKLYHARVKLKSYQEKSLKKTRRKQTWGM